MLARAVDADTAELMPGMGWWGALIPREAVERWPGAIAYVPQQVALVFGSVRDNVALGLPREAVDDTMVWEALERAYLAALQNDARYLAANKKLWKGTIMLLGQPAEERGSGAKAMLDDVAWWAKATMAAKAADAVTKAAAVINPKTGVRRVPLRPVTLSYCRTRTAPSGIMSTSRRVRHWWSGHSP